MTQFPFPSLPYPAEALAPVFTPLAVEIHYAKHHRGYCTQLNAMLAQQPACTVTSLEDLLPIGEGNLWAQAAQLWNHTFYWNCLTPLSQTAPPSPSLFSLLQQKFGSLEALQEAFIRAGLQQFGSGWVWLVKQSNQQLAILATGNAENPWQQGLQPLLCLDVWEHAYYLDYKNERARYLQQVWRLVNWQFVEEQWNQPFRYPLAIYATNR